MAAIALYLLFFFNDTATTEIYPLSLHDALPISRRRRARIDAGRRSGLPPARPLQRSRAQRDRKSTRLNSSHANISYAVFCLKKKKTKSVFLNLRNKKKNKKKK